MSYEPTVVENCSEMDNLIKIPTVPSRLSFFLFSDVDSWSSGAKEQMYNHLKMPASYNYYRACHSLLRIGRSFCSKLTTAGRQICLFGSSEAWHVCLFHGDEGWQICLFHGD